MSMLGAFAALYVTVTLFAIVMTFREQNKTCDERVFMNILGYAACLVWPVVLIALIVSSRRKDYA